ncbi:hypothetical protein [Halovenus halobia]|uniref:hypothetical protein n=1 Tax=Halovenus halobia TaxID=3396622 RepID=UPI003F5799E4
MRSSTLTPQDVIDRQLLIDIGFVGLLIAFLTAIHVGLPASKRAELVFHHKTVDPWTLLTSAYIHHDIAHLQGNIIGLLIATSTVYALCWQLGARRWFRLTTAAFLTRLPVLVSLSSYAIFRAIAPQVSLTSRGFSGVVAGFGGFLFAALIVWIASSTSRTTAVYLGCCLTVFMTWLVSLIYSGFEGPIAALSIIGIGASICGLVAETDSTHLRPQWQERVPKMGVGLGIILILLWFVVALFPPNPTSGGVTTNIFAHAAGFTWGTLIALVLWKHGM